MEKPESHHSPEDHAAQPLFSDESCRRQTERYVTLAWPIWEKMTQMQLCFAVHHYTLKDDGRWGEVTEWTNAAAALCYHRYKEELLLLRQQCGLLEHTP